MRGVELCVAAPLFLPTYGGAELRFSRYIPGLRRRGVHPHVFAGTPTAKKLTDHDVEEDWYRRPLGDLLESELLNGARVHRVRLPDKTGWRRTAIFNRTLLRFCQQGDHRPDLVQMLASLPTASLPWLLRLRSLGIPIAYAYTLPSALPNSWLRRAMQRSALRLLYRHLDCIIVPSAEMRSLVREMGVRTRIEVIPNGVDLERFQPPSSLGERRALRRSLGFDEDRMMIATIGTVCPRKGTDLLLEAWVRLAKRCPEVDLVIVGPRADLTRPRLDGFRQQLETLVAASGAPDRVRFAGLARNVEDYLKAADVFAFPSRREGMPNVVLEAMASGLPTILTPFIGLSKDFGKAGEQYLLVDRDPDALAAGIEQLLDKQALRSSLGRCGREWLEETMDLERSLDRYAALYRELASTSRARRRPRA